MRCSSVGTIGKARKDEKKLINFFILCLIGSLSKIWHDLEKLLDKLQIGGLTIKDINSNIKD